ncbi:MAG: hypothetical protein Q8P20_07990 [bacterium]|nr:hypothetical protein [bacterium]MDZ4227881.1 hypothetical protein [Candidatus Levybacteria bacterium]
MKKTTTTIDMDEVLKIIAEKYKVSEKDVRIHMPNFWGNMKEKERKTALESMGDIEFVITTKSPSEETGDIIEDEIEDEQVY